MFAREKDLDPADKTLGLETLRSKETVVPPLRVQESENCMSTKCSQSWLLRNF